MNDLPSALLDIVDAHDNDAYGPEEFLRFINDMRRFLYDDLVVRFAPLGRRKAPKWLCWLENARNFNPGHKKKASNFTLATQHIPFGASAMIGARELLDEVSEEYEQWVEATKDATDDCNDLLAYWEDPVMAKQYYRLAHFASRVAIQVLGGADAERSFVFWTQLMRTLGAPNMSALMKEVRVGTQYNRDVIARAYFEFKGKLAGFKKVKTKRT